MKEKLVSILIPAYNHEKYIQDTIKSAIEQTYKNIELIIIDDGSQDFTLEKINEMKSECEKRFSNFVLNFQENKGTCDTLNSLLEQAKGDYVLFLASDDILKHNAIEEEVEFLNNNPEYVLCVGDNEFIDNEGKVVYRNKLSDIASNSGEVAYKTFGEQLQAGRNFSFTSDSFGKHALLLPCNYIPNGCLIRKNTLDMIKFTNEAPLEDYFMMLQLSKYGKFKYFDKILFSYRCHSGNSIKDTSKMIEYTNKTKKFNMELTLKESHEKYLPEVREMIEKPKISIICTSFNHEKYMAAFMDSILFQTESNFEFIIIDDNSSDKTFEIASSYDDVRIKLLKHDFNKGINASLNDAISIARGKYCVLIASDDMLTPQYLEYASRYLDEHSDIDTYYSSLQIINENNCLINDPNNTYVRNISDRYVLLKQMFFYGNILLSPGMIVRKSALDKIMPLPISSLQYQDCLLHINLMLNGNVYQSPERMVYYRQTSQNLNVSARTQKVSARETLEENLYMDAFLKIKNVDLFKNIFKELAVQYGEPTEETLPYHISRLAMLAPKVERKIWGYNIFMNFYNKEGMQDLLYKLYKFTFKDYTNLIEFFK